VAKDKKCLHYCFYFIDEEFGLCYLRVPTWAPFRLQFTQPAQLAGDAATQWTKTWYLHGSCLGQSASYGYWVENVVLEAGKENALKMHSPALACFDL